MNELLLELLCEEIPARMQIKAAEQILALIEAELKNLNISFSNSLYYVTPRRLIFYIAGIPNEVPDTLIEKKGPKIDAKEEAITGFLRSVGLNKDELSIVDGCYYAKKIEKAKPINQSLKTIIEQILLSFTWPKSMRIGDSTSRNRWIRPLRNILCLFANEVLPIEFASLKANNYTYGHRFLAPEKMVINNFKDYIEKTNKAFVILDSNERQEIIIKHAKEIAQKLNLEVIIEPTLLSEVVGLVEYPNVLLGKFDQDFIKLPKEVLISAMKNHQRYFNLEDKQGNIAPYFIFVANVKHNDDSVIILGNEKVLQARFTDAKFFLEHDLKQPVSESLANLAKMTFHHKLGNMFDKTNRIIAIASFIAEKIGFQDLESLKTAALLAKTDLVSEMVGEFPELQGIMGGYYAKKFGESDQIAQAISEHYRPSDANDQGNLSLLGTIIAISDKLDSIIGLWLAGEKPTSSKDPFALRRAALGIIKLIRFHKMDLSLEELLSKTISEYEIPCDNNQEIISFLNERLKYYLKAENFRHDLIIATLSENSDNINLTIQNLDHLTQFIKTKEASSLVFAIKRILNILASSKEKLSLEINPKLFKPAEKNLFDIFTNLETVKTCEDLMSLVPAIDSFFEEIMVNDNDPVLRKNRLNLLNNIAHLTKQIADFNYIEV